MMEHLEILELILATIPESFHSKITEIIAQEGPIETLTRHVFYVWSEDQKSEAMRQVDEKSDGVFRKLLMDHFKMKKTIAIYETHVKFIKKVFLRFQKSFEALTLDQIETHDLSKRQSFLELFGYTARWVWNIDCPVWREALDHHYLHNPHHPQHGPGHQMEQCHLEESVVDMLACNWERKLGGSETATVEQIAFCEEIFLERYVQEDRIKVKCLLEKICSDNIIAKK